MQENNAPKKTHSKVISIIGWVVCAILALMLVFNLVIIIKGTVNPKRPPSVLGITPMVVLSGSMSGDADDHIEVGDLIFVTKADVAELKEGDVISYVEDKSTSVTTHRIIGVGKDENGNPLFTTKGDANNAEDEDKVTADRVIGIYRFRIPKVGDFALFLKEPLGMAIFIGVPLFAFIIYDVIRRQKAAAHESNKEAELQAEIERLRAMNGTAQQQSEELEAKEPEEKTEKNE